MKLFLTASTITPNLVQPFETFIGKSSKGLKAAFIPDAGLKVPGDKTWIDEEMKEVADDLAWSVDRVLLAEENTHTLNKLFEYDVIYVNGGYSGYLAQVMKESGFAELLPSLLANNVIYVGSSGGSMVLSKVQDAASFFFAEPEPKALTIGGLGLVNFEFYPLHDQWWSHDLVDKIKAKRNPTLTYYLVRDGQALGVNNDKVTTYGDVITFNKQ